MSLKVNTLHRIPNSNILIDYWNPVNSKKKFIRFMTLIRLEGNQQNLIRQDDYIIYTSNVNKWILKEHFKVPENRVFALKWNETTEIYDEYSREKIKVTMIGSNYCIGSCMFLFEGSFGNILFTGYFRPTVEKHIFEVPALKTLIEKKAVNVVYVDNSYAAEHCEFPPRALAVRQVTSLVRKHVDYKIIISAKRLGKEEVLVDIAKTFQKKVYVSRERYKFFTQLGIEKSFTTDRFATNIILEDHLFSLNECRERQSREGPCLIILLTAFHEFEKDSFVHRETVNVPNLHIVPYSGHCCHSELVDFLRILKPHRIEPIISEKKSRNYVIPDSIKNLSYNPANSYPLPDSDWNYQTCSDIVDSDILQSKADNSVPHYTEKSCNFDSKDNFISEEAFYTDKSRLHLVTQDENCSKPSDEDSNPGTDDVFYDIDDLSLCDVDHRNNFMNESDQVQQGNPSVSKYVENLKCNETSGDSSDDNFEDTVNSLEDTLITNTPDCCPYQRPDDNRTVNVVYCKPVGGITAANSLYHCLYKRHENEDAMNDKYDEEITEHLVSNNSVYEKEKSKKNQNKDRLKFECNQERMPNTIMNKEKFNFSTISSLLRNKDYPYYLSSNKKSVRIMENLSVSSQDTTEIIESPNSVYTAVNNVENLCVCNQHESRGQTKKRKLSKDEQKSVKRVFKNIDLSVEKDGRCSVSDTVDDVNQECNNFLVLNNFNLKKRENCEVNVNILRQNETVDSGNIKKSDENSKEAVDNRNVYHIFSENNMKYYSECTINLPKLSDEQILKINKVLWHYTMLVNLEENKFET